MSVIKGFVVLRGLGICKLRGNIINLLRAMFIVLAADGDF